MCYQIPIPKKKKNLTAKLNKHITHGWKWTDLMPNGQLSTGMVCGKKKIQNPLKKKKKHQTSSSFGYAANSAPTSADAGADSTLILLIERNIEKCKKTKPKKTTANPLLVHIRFNHQEKACFERGTSERDVYQFTHIQNTGFDIISHDFFNGYFIRRTDSSESLLFKGKPLLFFLFSSVQQFFCSS